MRNFSKTLISMAAVMAVGSAMAAGAMAGELGIKSDAIKTDGTITIESGVATGKSQYTLLVVKGATGVTVDADKDDYTKVDETTIKQIDQNDEGKAFSSVVLGKDLADGNYKVMVGNNDGTVDEGYFAVSSTPAVEYKTHYIGDVDADDEITMSDATYVLYKANWYDEFLGTYCADAGVPKTKKSGGALYVGDVDTDNEITMTDATYILYKANWYDEFLGTYCADAGIPVEIVK